MSHTPTHLDLTGLTQSQREQLAVAVDQFANSDDTAPNILRGADALPLDEIDRDDCDAKNELSDVLWQFPHPWFKGAAVHLEAVVARAACERDHADWHENPSWCICNHDTPTVVAAA